MRHRQKTYNVVYNVARTTGKNINVRYRTFFWRYRTLYVRCRPKNVRYCIRPRIRYRTYDRQEQYFDVRYRTSDVRYRIQYSIRYMHEQKLFRSHHNAKLSIQALFHPCHLKTAMTRIVHGIRMMKGILLTSTLHLLAQWHTTPYYRVPCLFSVHCSGLECPRQSGSGQCDQRTRAHKTFSWHRLNR